MTESSYRRGGGGGGADLLLRPSVKNLAPPEQNLVHLL